MVDRIRYALRHPIETLVGEEKTTIVELHLAPVVKGRHMKATDQARGPVEAKIMLISSLAGITRAEGDELAEVDILAIDALYGEPSDLSRIAEDLGLPATASVDEVRRAIAGLQRRDLSVPLAGGASTSGAGPTTGAA